MDRFYGATDLDPVEHRTEQINHALFNDAPAVAALLAWDDTHLVGIASYSTLWPAVGTTPSLFLKELYVTEHHRQAGIGQLLMQRLAHIAVEQGCSRLEWTTDTTNTDAQRFYDHLGVAPVMSKLFYRLEGDALRSFQR